MQLKITKVAGETGLLHLVFVNKLSVIDCYATVYRHIALDIQVSNIFLCLSL